jgi:hypothetical protein
MADLIRKENNGIFTAVLFAKLEVKRKVGRPM